LPAEKTGISVGKESQHAESSNSQAPTDDDANGATNIDQRELAISLQLAHLYYVRKRVGDSPEMAGTRDVQKQALESAVADAASYYGVSVNTIRDLMLEAGPKHEREIDGMFLPSLVLTTRLESNGYSYENIVSYVRSNLSSDNGSPLDSNGRSWPSDNIDRFVFAMKRGGPMIVVDNSLAHDGVFSAWWERVEGNSTVDRGSFYKNLWDLRLVDAEVFESTTSVKTLVDWYLSHAEKVISPNEAGTLRESTIPRMLRWVTHTRPNGKLLAAWVKLAGEEHQSNHYPILFLWLNGKIVAAVDAPPWKWSSDKTQVPDVE
jgi:hypothetical protein